MSKTMENLPIADSYEDNFDPDWYLNIFYTDNNDRIDDTEAGRRLTFSLDCFHETFKNSKFGGETLLDIGTGPTVHSVISASCHVTEIHLSDLVDRNRDILKRWRDGEPNAMPSFKYILEMENDGTNLEDRVTTVRDRVTQIYPLDLRVPEPLPGSARKYDIIIASLSLSAAVKDKKDFENVVAKVTAMMKVNGRLIISDVLKGTFYRVGNFRFHSPNLSRDETKEVLTNAGLHIETWKEMGGYKSIDKGKISTDIDGDYAIFDNKR